MAKADHQPAEEAAIKVSGVSKDFALPHEKVNSLKGHFTKLFNMNRTIEVQHALRDVSFEVKKGEFFGIVGRNGGGKSTLLKILAGIYQPTKGKMQINGKLVPFIELGVGFNPELTGRENVYLNGALLGFSKKEMDAQYDEIVAFTELEDFMDQKLKNYSSGMQVRLAFSLAIRAKAEVLLVDEVLAVGDDNFKRKCYTYFKSLKKSDTTVVFVTHDMEAVREYCDRAMLINSGSITHIGKPDRAASEYSKLFNQSVVGRPGNDDSSRWGTRLVEFDSVSAHINDKELTVELTIRSNSEEEVEDAIIGLAIKSEDGRIVTGTNTYRHRRDLTLKSKEVRKVRFVAGNVFGAGIFRVHANLRLNDKVTVLDDWDNAATFVNTSETSGYFSVILPGEWK